jgi:23S rRNA (adenine2030-N6)-methyltransferase
MVSAPRLFGARVWWQPMNYRHGFHAGNFAEVVKHAVLARVIVQLRAKPGAFRVIDTHAGPGVTELTGPQASRTGEWHHGIERLLASRPTGAVAELLAPYLRAVAKINPDGRLVAYPGSSALAQTLMRAHDRLIACELEPNTAAQLTHSLRGDRRAKAVRIDGWTALAAYVPPKERRGAMLIDPPFEAAGEFTRIAEGLARAHRKWPTGIYLLWYPIKDPVETDAFARRLANLDIPKMLRAEVAVAPSHPDRLSGSGLIIVNPPWLLERELAIMLPSLADILGDDREGHYRLSWLREEK